LGARPLAPLGWLACPALALAPLVIDLQIAVLLELPLFLLIVGLIWELFRHERAPVRDLGATILGVYYVGWLFTYLVHLRLTPGVMVEPRGGWFEVNSLGARLVLFAFVTTWACDTAAYFAGRTFGKHKLAPTISPGKTIEGSVGGLLGSVVIALLVGGLAGFPMSARLVLGLAVGVFCQLGDLCASAMKREMGIKDFGAVIPGHGGVLDRFDSLLFVAPVVSYLSELMGSAW